MQLSEAFIKPTTDKKADEQRVVNVQPGQQTGFHGSVLFQVHHAHAPCFHNSNIARIANAVQCHSLLSGLYDCNVLMCSIVRNVKNFTTSLGLSFEGATSMGGNLKQIEIDSRYPLVNPPHQAQQRRESPPPQQHQCIAPQHRQGLSRDRPRRRLEN